MSSITITASTFRGSSFRLTCGKVWGYVGAVKTPPGCSLSERFTSWQALQSIIKPSAAAQPADQSSQSRRAETSAVCSNWKKWAESGERKPHAYETDRESRYATQVEAYSVSPARAFKWLCVDFQSCSFSVEKKVDRILQSTSQSHSEFD